MFLRYCKLLHISGEKLTLLIVVQERYILLLTVNALAPWEPLSVLTIIALGISGPLSFDSYRSEKKIITTA
jgi:hypothetical protein